VAATCAKPGLQNRFGPMVIHLASLGMRKSDFTGTWTYLRMRDKFKDPNEFHSLSKYLVPFIVLYEAFEYEHVFLFCCIIRNLLRRTNTSRQLCHSGHIGGVNPVLRKAYCIHLPLYVIDYHLGPKRSASVTGT